MAFIVFEGADGVGKSTHVGLLATKLLSLGRKVTLLHEPTNGPWGQRIRTAARTGNRPDPLTELQWFTEDRKEDVAQNILPALEEGHVVILDRYFYSTAAYQGTDAVSRERILAANRAFAPEPDLCIFLRLEPVAARDRIASRGIADAFEAFSYQQQVAAAFDWLAEGLIRDNTCPVLRLDTSGPVAEVAQTVWETVLPLVTESGDALAQCRSTA